ncbi:RNA-binding protein 26-like [Physella acuta]|uniref:RNA-binding protein 26-like n=1 Tax=Physella acuta TaxID=109671 RepID=UPI0027DC4DE7|nr:RNA-binding protein 26-like [Physella acuta]
MIIEQVEALKTWLTNKLSPICDAEPSALAKYVCALVKKDKPEQDLRDICVDQLDVFLQQNTKPFVDELFEVLKSKQYIPPASEKTRPVVVAAPIKPENKPDIKTPHLLPGKDKEDAPKRKFSEISSTTDDKENKESSAVISLTGTKEPSSDFKESKDISREPRATSRDARDRDPEGSRDRRDSWRDEKNKEGIRDARDIIRENRERVDRLDPRADTREVREPRDRDHRDRERDFRRRRTRSRSISPRRREYDDRRKRYDERPRYSPDRRWGRRRSWSRSPRRVRSPIDRNLRARSRSPRLRSRSPRYRPFRSRTRSRSPRPRSWSRLGSPARLRTRSPSNVRQPDSRGSTPLQDNDYISSSTNDLPAVTSTVGFRAGEERSDNRIPTNLDVPPPVFPTNARLRCQNFEEKGFCMLGDVCPYDHGSDPVVVEDVSIPSVLPGSNGPSIAAASSVGFIPPDLRVPPPGHIGMRINLNRPPPTHVEPYLPEAPRLQGPPRVPFIRGPPDLRQPPPGMILNRPPHPDQYYPPRREIIMNRPLLSDDAADNLQESSRIVIPAKRPYIGIDSDPNLVTGPPPPRMAYVNQHHSMFGVPPQQPLIPPQLQPPQRRGFDYSRLGNRGSIRPQVPRLPYKTGNLTLEVRKIPPEFNNIAKLNEHFGKFGNLTNIQVKYQNDQGAALISFSNNGEATAAYRSPEPVFNNRFIKLFWHNPEKQVDMDGETESPVVTMREDGKDVNLPSAVTGGRVGDGIDHPSLVLPVRPNIPPAHKLQLDNTKPKVGAPEPVEATPGNEPVEKSIVYTSSVGNLKKTVFNPSATVPPTTTVKPKGAVPFTSPTAVKTADYVSRMEAIKRQEEDKKLATVKQAELEVKKQELLSKQIEQQKILIETLEKKRNVLSEEEKKSLLQALRTISDAIDKVKYGTGAKKPPATGAFPTPPHAQFKYVSSQEHVQQPAPIPAQPMYGRGRGWSGGRGAWIPRGRGRGLVQFGGRTHLDNRPKTVEVKGFDLAELEEIKAHFLKFGEIDKEEIVEEIPSAFFTFSLRHSAEMAVAQGAKFKKKILVVRWNQITPKISRAESTQSSEVDEDLSVNLESLDDDILLEMSGEEKLENSNTDSLSSAVPNQSLEPSSAASEVQEMEEDSRTFVDSVKEDKPLVVESKSVIYERSLSEDLLAGDEEHFKASYTDEEDDEDHITVTLSSTASTTPTIYTSGASYNAAVSMEQETRDIIEEEDMNTNLDYNEEGSWN